MKALRFRSSHIRSFWKLQTSTVIGLGQQASKGGCTATFVTSIESIDEDAEITDDMSLAGSPFKNNHSTQTQTAPSLNNLKNTLNTQKQHGQADDRFIKGNSTKIQMETKNISHISSESQAPNRGADWDTYGKVFRGASGRDGQISNNPQPISPNHINMLVTNYRSKEWDAFAELDGPGVDLEHEKISTCINRILSSNKEQQISAVSDAKMTEVQVARDDDFSKKSIPAREKIANKRDYLLARAKKFSNSKSAALKFVLEDNVREEKEKKEVKEKKDVAMKQKEQKEKKGEVAMKQKPFNQDTESNSIHGEKSVCVEYVPHGISVLEIRKAFSVYGDIVGCFIRAGDDGMSGCHIEFKTTEDKERALSDRWVIVNGKQLSVCRVDIPVTTIVRITNLDPETALNDVHKICMSYGNMESLQMREDYAVDAYFCISESRNMPKILEKLNEVTLNKRRWIAQPAPRLAKCMSETPEGQKWAGKQLSNQIHNIKNHLRLKRIYLEDLEELHGAIMHIKECPNPSDNGST